MKSSRFDHITDADLLNRYYIDNDQQWIGILLERYTLLLFGICMKYLKDEHAAKDCVQQIFLKVLTEVNKYKVDYFKSWLYMVAKNHCLMKLRDKNSKEFKEIKEYAIPVQDVEKADVFQNELAYDKLEEALNELVEEQRLCVISFYLKKNSYQQIAEKTGYSPMQVKSYIQNGKRNLKLILERKLKQSKDSNNG